jgi:ubiquinone/menaquinone biosynthesis C-methylase UbiE
MTRALVKKRKFTTKVTGIDQSSAFIKAAGDFAHKEGVGELLEFAVGDSHQLDFSDESFDIVIAHTLISHVSEPETVLKEFARVLRKDGTLVIFDGDYASLTFAYPEDDRFGRDMDHALATTTFNNPLVMRDIIRLLPELDLELTDTLVEVVSEIGQSSYFKSFAETYAPMVADGGMLPKQAVVRWLASQQGKMQKGTFFASCNYYTYLIHRK